MQNHSESRVYAGFFVRLIAYGIDMLIASIAVAAVKLPFSIAASNGAGFLKSNFIFTYSFLDVLGYVGIAAYFVLLTYFAHTTVGKILFHLEVSCEREWSFVNVLYRETVGRFLSSLLNIGYLAVIVQKEKQGFHDMLCDTHVVYKNMFQEKTRVWSPSVITPGDETASPPPPENTAIKAWVQGTELAEGTAAGIGQKGEAEIPPQVSETLPDNGEQPVSEAVLKEPESEEQPVSEVYRQPPEERPKQTWAYYSPKEKQEPAPQIVSAFEVTKSNPQQAEARDFIAENENKTTE